MDEIAGVEWRVTAGLTPYEDALAEMERRAAAVRGSSPELRRNAQDMLQELEGRSGRRAKR